jgi:hypothetical protein
METLAQADVVEETAHLVVLRVHHVHRHGVALRQREGDPRVVLAAVAVGRDVERQGQPLDDGAGALQPLGDEERADRGHHEGEEDHAGQRAARSGGPGSARHRQKVTGGTFVIPQAA